LSPEREGLGDDFVQSDRMPMDSSESDADIQDHLGKDFSALADIYWVFFFYTSVFFNVKVHDFFVAVRFT